MELFAQNPKIKTDENGSPTSAHLSLCLSPGTALFSKNEEAGKESGKTVIPGQCFPDCGHLAFTWRQVHSKEEREGAREGISVLIYFVSPPEIPLALCVIICIIY